MTALTARVHLPASEIGGERRWAQHGPWCDDGLAQVVEGRQRRGRREWAAAAVAMGRG